MKLFIQKFGITIYILLLSAHLYAQVLGDQYATIQFITKALLLPTLMLFLACHDKLRIALMWAIIMPL
jgi:hypothetical protein